MGTSKIAAGEIQTTMRGIQPKTTQEMVNVTTE